MIVGIHKDIYPNRRESCQRYRSILAHNGIEVQELDVNEPAFWDQVARVDLFLFRWHHTDYHADLAHAILPVIEGDLGVPCFPNQRTCWHFDDKVKQYYTARACGLPMVPSWIFWEREPALAWLSGADFPLVFKLKGGAGSQNVLLLKERQEAQRVVELLFRDGIEDGRIPLSGATAKLDRNLAAGLRQFASGIKRRLEDELDYRSSWKKHKNYVLFQKFLPGNGFDTRVTVIGGRAFAFRRLNRDDDFRSSGSGRIDYDRSQIDLKAVALALEVSAKMGFQSMAYDFLRDETGGYRFCEMSYTFKDSAVQQCAGHWDGGLNWHEGRLWPEYLHLKDALGLPDLKQPEGL